MKKSITACLGVCLLASSAFAATVTVKNGDDFASKLNTAKDGDTVLVEAGKYKIKKMSTSADIEVIGVPYENSQNRADINKVIIQCTDMKNDAWVTFGKTTLRGLRFEGGDHQVVAENEILVEYCVFDEGVDQISFNKPGYGTVRFCELYRSGDDGIDMDSNANANGAYFDIHNNWFEATREDGIEFRTYGRKNIKGVMPIEFHHNTFFNCGTDMEEEGGDVIQIIDQEEDGASTREVYIYNNIMDGNNQSWNGVACNVKNSDAQHGSVGGPKLNDPILVWNNTILNLKGTAVAGDNKTAAFNNAIKNCKKGAFVRCEAKNNIIESSNPIFGVATSDKGGNVEKAININAATYAPNSGSPLAGAGIASYSAFGLTVQGDNDVGAIAAGSGPDKGTPVKFSGNLLDKGAIKVGDAFSGSIAADAVDADGDAITFSKVSGASWLKVAADGTLSGTPNAEGESKIVVKAEDKDGSDTTEVVVKVLPADVALVADAGEDQTVQAVSGTGSARLSAVDSTGSIVSYVWKEGNDVLTSGPQTDHDFTVGTHVVTLVVTDIDGNTATDEVIITVLPEGPAVSIDAGADIEVETERGTTIAVELSAVASEDDVVWKKDNVRVGEGATITVELGGGVHTFVARVKDAEGNVARDEVVVTVVEVEPQEPNNAPVFKGKVILSTKAKAGKAISKDISNKAKDADKDPLTFSKDKGPAWLKVAANGKISGTPAASDKGNNVFTIKVEDGRGGSDTATVKIKVK